MLLSVEFIDEKNNRRWTYDNVTKIETGLDSIFVTCHDYDGTRHVFAPLEPEFSKIIITREAVYDEQ